MALTLNDNFLAAVNNASAPLRFLFRFDLNTSVSYKFTDGLCDHMDYPVSVQKFDPVSRGIDPVSPTVSTSNVVMRLRLDDAVSTMVVDYGFKGAWVDIKIGTSELAEEDFEPHFGGVVEGVTLIGESVQVTVKPPSRSFFYKRILFETDWFARNTLEILEQMIDLTNMDSTWFDANSLDPSNYTSTISHHVAGRPMIVLGGNLPVVSKQRAEEATDQLLSIVDGHMINQESGDLEFKLFDSALAVEDTWDFYKDLVEFSVGDVYKDMVNEMTVNAHTVTTSKAGKDGRVFQDIGNEAAKTDPQTGHTVTDTASIARYGSPASGGIKGNIKTAKLDTEWISGWGNLRVAMTGSEGPGDTLQVWGGVSWSMSGARWPGYPAGSQPAWAKPTTDRLVYLLIDDEVISCRDSTVYTEADKAGFGEMQLRWFDFNNLDEAYRVVPNGLEYEIHERRALGTTSAAMNHAQYARAYDVTISEYIASKRVERLSNGGWPIKCKTRFDKYGVQVADLVSLIVPESKFIAFGQRGLDSTVKLQVINKKPIRSSDASYIEWDLMFAKRETPHTYTPSRTIRKARYTTPPAMFEKSIENEYVNVKHISTGFGYSGISGLDITIEAGVANTADTVMEWPEDYVLTVTDDADTYVGFDFRTQSLYTGVTTTGGAQPLEPQTVIYLWKVPAAAGAIGTPVDLRPTQALDGGKLMALSVDSTEIADAAVITAKVDDQAINNAKVLDYDLGLAKVNLQVEIGETLNPNPSFSLRTLG